MLKSPKRQKNLDEQWQPNRAQKHTMLDAIDQIVDWKPIEKKLHNMYSPVMGRPAIPPLAMFKLLLIEMFYNLSDVQVVEELKDRRSFERFCGLDLVEDSVDDTTLVKFRERLRQHGLMEKLFEEFNKQLERRGLYVKKGSLIDSTLVEGHHRPGKRGKDGKVLDSDVAWTVRDGKPLHGMKVSLSVDEKSELIRDVVFTPASVHDEGLFGELVCGDERKAYADKGYASEENRRFLRAQGIGDGICYKAVRERPLKKWQMAVNRFRSRHRVAVERKVAEIKEHHSMRRLRYSGIERNWVQVVLTVIVINLTIALKRACLLTYIQFLHLSIPCF